LVLQTLSTSSFRNLQTATVALEPGRTLVVGDNGQGKTNLLESICVLGNLRSFRHASVRRLTAHGKPSFCVDGVVTTTRGPVHLRQTVVVGPPVRRQLEVNGATVALDHYLSVLPVFVLSRADTDLVEGAPEGRRAMIDRLAFFLDSRHLHDLREYRRCLRQRNAALTAKRRDAEVEAWERGLSEAAARVICRRRVAIASFSDRFRTVYAALRGRGFPDIEAEYRGESWLSGRIDKEVAEKYRQRYHETRARDRLAGFTLEGPHRHDLLLRTGGRTVRDVLSAGQVKTVAAALCIATLAEVEERKDETLPVLVDDADAEIDEHVLKHLLAVLGERRQVVLSSAHGEVLERIVDARVVLTMIDGRVQRSPVPREVGS
jgi:DNA replication and repair protein RecF